MMRQIYVAGVNRKHLAAAAAHIPYWLLSATLVRKYPSWLAGYLPGRTVLWDPGTFSEEAISYHRYREFIDRYARSVDEFLQYDEIGDAEATAWYLRDMRRRGYRPIPVLQPGGEATLLAEKRLAIGGLVPMEASDRRRYLDTILYGGLVQARIHLLGMWRPEWFAPYSEALSGDSTTWIPRGEYNRQKSMAEWLEGYGDQWIPIKRRAEIQMSLVI